MDVSENSATPKSSILIGFSIINHPFWGTTILGNTHINNLRYSNFVGFGAFLSRFLPLLGSGPSNLSKFCHN